MSRGMQLYFISITAFSDRFIFRSDSPGIRLPYECHDQSQETDVTASPERNCLYCRKEKVY